MFVLTRQIDEGVVCELMPTNNPQYISTYTGSLLSTYKDTEMNVSKPLSLDIFVERIAGADGNKSMKLAFDDPNKLFNFVRIDGVKKEYDTTILELSLGEGFTLELLPAAHLALAANAFLTLAANYGIKNNATDALLSFTEMYGFGNVYEKSMAVSVLVIGIDDDHVELEIDAPKDMFRVTRSERTLVFLGKKRTS